MHFPSQNATLSEVNIHNILRNFVILVFDINISKELNFFCYSFLLSFLVYKIGHFSLFNLTIKKIRKD